MSAGCSANLQVGILKSRRCSPEGERYINQNLVFSECLQPFTIWLPTSGICSNILPSKCGPTVPVPTRVYRAGIEIRTSSAEDSHGDSIDH